MPYEEEMNWKIPCFPIFLKISTVPPVHIEASISESNDFRDDIKQKMKQSIESKNPADCIWDRQS